MGQHDGERWKVEHDIKVSKVKEEGVNPLVVILIIALILGVLFGR